MKIKLLYLSLLVLVSCKTDTQKTEHIVEDTLTTDSGLKLVYKEKGEGLKIEKGSKFYFKVKLFLDDSLVFENDNGQTIHDPLGNNLIEGMIELNGLLHEGDKVVALMPSSIAYGDEQRGPIYPGATLEFHKEITKVEQPKKLLYEELVSKYKNGNVKLMLDEYERITTTRDSLDYHLGVENLFEVSMFLIRDEKYLDALTALNSSLKMTANPNEYVFLRTQRVDLLDKLGRKQEAIDSLNILIEQNPDRKELIDFKTEIKQSDN